MHIKNIKYLLLVVLLITVTGCTKGEDIPKSILGGPKTLTCTKEEVDEDGFKTFETMKIKYDKKTVLEVDAEQLMETDPEYLDMIYGFGTSFAETLNEVDGYTVKYDKVDENTLKFTTKLDYKKFNPELLKEALGELYDEEDNDFTSKTNYTIEEFKEEHLQDYDCK